MASIQVTEITSSSVTFKLTLGSAFNSSNYIEVGITDEAFINESTELVGTKHITKSAPSNGTSTEVLLEVTGLEPETTYYFYGYAMARNGYYYRVGNGIQVTTDSVEYPAPIIDSFEVWQIEPYNDFKIRWSFYAYELFDNFTEYTVRARKKGNSGWTVKTSGVITLPETDVEDFNVSSDGEWEFRFILNNGGVTTYKDVTLTVVSYSTPVINSFSVEQTSPYVYKEVALSCDLDNVVNGVTTYELQANKPGTSMWSIIEDGAVQNSDITITNIAVPNVGEWNFRLVLDTGGATVISDVVTLNIVDGLTITELTVLARGGVRFGFRYEGAEEATGFNVRIKRNYDDYVYVGNVSHISGATNGLIIWETDDEEWKYGVQCTLEIQTYNQWGYGYWVTYGLITSAPAEPILSLSQSSGKISVGFGVKEETGVTSIKLSLYRGDIEDEDYSLIESGEYIIAYGDTNPSGVYQFETLCEDNVTYTVLANSVLNFKDIGISNDFDGKEKVEASSKYYPITIYLSGKPQLWEWTQIYELSTGGTGTICAEAYVPMDKDGIHPCTAAEWAAFATKINEVRAWVKNTYGSNAVSGYDIDVSEITSGADFKTHYNIAVDAIKQISGVGGDLQKIKSGDELNSHLFTFIRDELNAGITNL